MWPVEISWLVLLFRSRPDPFFELRGGTFIFTVYIEPQDGFAVEIKLKINPVLIWLIITLVIIIPLLF